MEKACRNLTVAEVIEINRRFCDSRNEPHGILNPGSLEHTFEQVQGTIFGKELHPSIEDKAAFLLSRLASGHYFVNANKRTAFMVCMLFLHLNGKNMTAEDQEILDIAGQIAQSLMTETETLNWLTEHID